MADAPGGFSSQSYSPSSSKAKSEAKMDPQDQKAKKKEKDQMVGLNDKFVALIEKVGHLEDKNKVLETRLKILLEQDSYKGNIDDLVKELTANLQQQISDLARDWKKLEDELAKSQEGVDNSRVRYEDEIQKKTEAENDFVLTKKDVDESYLQRVDLELKIEDLQTELAFLKKGYDEEIKELQSKVCNETVVLRCDDGRHLDMNEILDMVKSQYQDMVNRSRDEAEQWNKRKIDDMVLKVGKHEQDVKDMKKEIAESQRIVQRQTHELDALKKKKENLEADISNSEDKGQKAVLDARAQVAQLEEALRRDKQVMVHQVREYQELMNLKLALDIEIMTYRKLLEGEEQRMAENRRDQLDVKASDIGNQEPTYVTGPDKPKKSLLIKIEVKDGRVISESSKLF